jgi:hypothetical protein
MGNNLPISQVSKTLQNEEANFSFVSTATGHPVFTTLNLYRRDSNHEEVMVGLVNDFDEEKSNILKREKIISPGLINIYHFESEEKKPVESGASCFSSGGIRLNSFIRRVLGRLI